MLLSPYIIDMEEATRQKRKPNRIACERKLRHWTQTQLAARAAMHQGDITRLESGRAIPSPAQARRLALVLGVPAAELLDEAMELKDKRP